MDRQFSFRLNGRQVSVSAPPAYTLLEVLREKLDVTSPKEDCKKGECGACTVLIDGEPMLSCVTLAWSVRGRSITTIEGLAGGESLHPLQQAFLDKGAVQCGFCTPGMVLSAKALLDKTSDPSKEEIKEALAGNLCRCTGYVKIVEAVQAAAKLKQGDPTTW